MDSAVVLSYHIIFRMNNDLFMGKKTPG